MAWTNPATATAGSTALTAAFWNEQVRDNQSYLYTPPMCVVRRTTNLTGYVAPNAITWSQEDIDTDSMFSSGTQVNITTAGVYLIRSKIYVTCTATLTNVAARISVNGALREYIRYPSQDTTSGYAECTKVLNLAANDKITAEAEFAGGSNYAIGGSATDNHTASSLSVMWLGKA